MTQTLGVGEFIKKYESDPVLLLDARSEKEFDHAHIPGAVNLPLLNNENRHLIGIEYKKNGREAAVALGFKLVGPVFHEFIEKAKKLTDRKQIMIYCWRGGMRSGIMSWILSMAGYKVTLLNGGYKSFRNYILDQFKTNRNIIIVGGNTGSGKTDVLKELRLLGMQTIDLENLANHRGSAFGNLGLPPQPSTEYFENLLGLQWKNTDSSQILWIEGESRTIGRVKIPDDVFNQLQAAPMMELKCTKEFRKKRIIDEYGVFKKEELAECTSKLKKKLGNLRLSEALHALEAGDLDAWLEILIKYYDDNYTYSMEGRNALERTVVNVEMNESLAQVANRLIQQPLIKVKSIA